MDYPELKSATPEELGNAYILYLRSCFSNEDSFTKEDLFDYLEELMKIMGQNGWEYIAPAWLKAYKSSLQPRRIS